MIPERQLFPVTASRAEYPSVESRRDEGGEESLPVLVVSDKVNKALSMGKSISVLVVSAKEPKEQKVKKIKLAKEPKKNEVPTGPGKPIFVVRSMANPDALRIAPSFTSSSSSSSSGSSSSSSLGGKILYKVGPTRDGGK